MLMEWWVGILSLLTSDNGEMLVYSINGVMKFTPCSILGSLVY